MAEILPDLLAAFDAKKLAMTKQIAEALGNQTGSGWLAQKLAQNQEDRQKELTSVGNEYSVMPEVAAQAREDALKQGMNVAGMFVGPGGAMPAKQLERYQKAQLLESEGKTTREAIRQQTGWVRGLDGNWHREVSDAGTYMTPDWLYMNHGSSSRLGDIMPHSDLYSVYPWLQDMPVTKEGTHGTGSYHKSYGIKVGSSGDMNMDRLSLLHEVQHAVQEHEGWAPGGNPNTPEAITYAIGKVKEEANQYRIDNPGQFMPLDQMKKLMEIHKEEGYRRLAGEAQARLTEERADLGDLMRQRTALKPDVPQSLIIQQPPNSDMYNLPKSLLPGSVTDLLGLPPVKP